MNRFTMVVVGLLVASSVQAEMATVTVSRESVEREVRFDGVVDAVNRSTVAAQTSGRVMDLPYDVGDEVPPGAVIVRLTSAGQAAQFEAADGAVAEARARLTEARANFQRAQDIYEQKLIAKAEFDQVAANFRAAQARLDSTEAARRQAREDLDYTLVKAPYGGIVENRLVQLGESVAPGTPLMTGLSLDQLRVLVDVPQQHIQALRTHRQARLLLSDGEFLAAERINFPPAANPAAHSFQLRVDLPPGDHGLFPGMLVKLAFVSGQEDRLLLPPAAVVRRGELTAAYVREADGRISLRLLRLGSPLADGRVPVESGLDAGETVLLDALSAARAYQQQAPAP